MFHRGVSKSSRQGKLPPLSNCVNLLNIPPVPIFPNDQNQNNRRFSRRLYNVSSSNDANLKNTQKYTQRRTKLISLKQISHDKQNQLSKASENRDLQLVSNKQKNETSNIKPNEKKNNQNKYFIIRRRNASKVQTNEMKTKVISNFAQDQILKQNTSIVNENQQFSCQEIFKKKSIQQYGKISQNKQIKCQLQTHSLQEKKYQQKSNLLIEPHKSSFDEVGHQKLTSAFIRNMNNHSSYPTIRSNSCECKQKLAVMQIQQKNIEQYLLNFETYKSIQSLKTLKRSHILQLNKENLNHNIIENNSDRKSIQQINKSKHDNQLGDFSYQPTKKKTNKNKCKIGKVKWGYNNQMKNQLSKAKKQNQVSFLLQEAIGMSDIVYKEYQTPVQSLMQLYEKIL